MRSRLAEFERPHKRSLLVDEPVRVVVPISRVNGMPSLPIRASSGRRAAAAALIVCAVVTTGTAVAVSPWFVGFGVAVVAAAAWCAWLERHPD